MSTPGTSTLICCPITVRNTISSGQAGNCIYTTAGHEIWIYILPCIHHFGCSACGFFSSNREGFANHLTIFKTTRKKVPSMPKNQGTKYITVDVLRSAVTQRPSKEPKVLTHNNQTCIIHNDSYYYSCFCVVLHLLVFLNSDYCIVMHWNTVTCQILLQTLDQNNWHNASWTGTRCLPCTKQERYWKNSKFQVWKSSRDNKKSKPIQHNPEICNHVRHLV